MSLKTIHGELVDMPELSAASLDAQLNACFSIERERGMPVSHIYALVDPRTDEIRYIGKSIRPYQRLQNHMNEPPTNCHRSHWLRELRGLGVFPRLVVIESICGEWPWQEAERHWIHKLREEGVNLVNNTDGGDGVVNLPPASRERIIAASRGRKPSPETLAKMSAVRKGRKDRPESKLKRIETLKKVVHRAEWNERVAQAVRKLAEEDISIIRQELASGVQNKELAARYGVHRTTISKVKMGTYLQRYRKNAAVTA